MSIFLLAATTVYFVLSWFVHILVATFLLSVAITLVFVLSGAGNGDMRRNSERSVIVDLMIFSLFEAGFLWYAYLNYRQLFPHAPGTLDLFCVNFAGSFLSPIVSG